MSEAMPLQTGQSFAQGRFVLVQRLGRGGMGEVWLARDERLQEQVALKFLPPEIRGDPVGLDDLRRETARSHKLSHPNIVRIHDLHEEPDGTAFIVMEYIDGPTLAALRLQKPSRVLSWDYLRPLVEQLCAALDYAHGEKVIHRDLKPANMMVDSRGRLKLADFGIAAVASDSMSRISLRHSTSGTLPYMSPQQLTGKRPQATDDIYALGATLYELLTSKPPFYTGDLTHQVLHEPPEPMEERLAALEIENPVPPDVAALVMACLAKEPGPRPQSARAVAEWIGLEIASKPSLEILRREVFPEAEPSAGPPGTLEIKSASPVASGPGKKFLWVGGVITACLLLAAGGWYWARQAQGRNSPTAKAQVGPVETNLGAVLAEPAAQAERAPIPETNRPSTDRSAAPEDGFISLFNGHDLSGWDGDPRFWSVEDNAIKGQTTAGNIPEKGNTYLIWTKGMVDDFELRFSYKLVDGDTGSGILYRGKRTTGWGAHGYHADFWSAATGNSGLLAYEAPGGGGRPGFGRLVGVGEKAIWDADGKHIAGYTAKSAAEIGATIKDGDWNDYVITAIGNHLVHQINGNISMEMTDNDVQRRFLSGILGLKVRPNKGKPMLVYFKNIRLKRLTHGTTLSGSPAPAVSPTVKKLLVVTVTKAYRHGSIPTGNRVLAALARQDGRFTLDYIDSDEEMAAKMTVKALQPYDGAIFNNTSGDLPLPDKQGFLDWIASGKAFIGIHAALDTYSGRVPLDPFIQMLGAELKSHGPQTTVECLNQDPWHPACKHLGRRWTIHDEIFILNGFDASAVHTLLTLDKEPNKKTPGNYPISWCKNYGNGKVFCTSLGHRDDVWESEAYQKHLLGGLCWALGSKTSDGGAH